MVDVQTLCLNLQLHIMGVPLGLGWTQDHAGMDTFPKFWQAERSVIIIMVLSALIRFDKDFALMKIHNLGPNYVGGSL